MNFFRNFAVQSLRQPPIVKIRTLILLTAIVCAISAKAISFDLDSIAAMGRFPRFCVDTYRWGDKFFNGYDTTYVDGTGYKFNLKLRTDSWTDYYNLHFDNGTEMSMISEPSTSVGFYLTYMALSVGYDMNVSKYFNGGEEARKSWNFGFNCMLFSAKFYFVSNDVGTHISTLHPYGGDTSHPDVLFKGVNNTNWGFDLLYFLSHKRYSHAAAFNFSRLQNKSGGSFFLGFSFNRIKYDFDFNQLPADILATLPTDIPDNHYIVNAHNYVFPIGYGYNWAFARHWLLGASVTVMPGWSNGYYKEADTEKTVFTTLAKNELSIVWNNRHWFAGLIGDVRLNMVRDDRRSMLSSVLNLEVSLGYRFNLW